MYLSRKKNSNSINILVIKDELGLHPDNFDIKNDISSIYHCLVILVPRLMENQIKSNTSNKGKSHNRNVGVSNLRMYAYQVYSRN